METPTVPRPFVFVLMPFSEDFADTYQLGIKPACEEAGAYCERVDEQTFHESILQRVYNQIAKADFIVAEMTGRNPNVFYEVGYAHALGKRVILLTRDAGDIPFDLKHFPHIVYGGRISQLKQDLKARVQYFIEHPNVTVVRTAQDLEFYSSGQMLLRGGTLWMDAFIEYVENAFLHEQVANLHGTLDVHNPTPRFMSGDQYRFAVISKAILCLEDNPRHSTIHQPDGSGLVRLPSLDDLFPDEWTSLNWTMVLAGPQPDDQFEAILRVYTEVAHYDYPLRVKYRLVD